ncbi:MAG: hypothetical protein AAFX99_16205 [Myxococcota bacterium]
MANDLLEQEEQGNAPDGNLKGVTLFDPVRHSDPGIEQLINRSLATTAKKLGTLNTESEQLAHLATSFKLYLVYSEGWKAKAKKHQKFLDKALSKHKAGVSGTVYEAWTKNYQIKVAQGAPDHDTIVSDGKASQDKLDSDGRAGFRRDYNEGSGHLEQGLNHVNP